MASKRKLNIGITINLENYENLRVEVESEVSDIQETEDLVLFLDGILARMGRNDANTATRVDNYRNRVLSRPVSAAKLAPEGEEPRREPPLESPPEEVLVADQPVIEEVREGDLTESLYHTPADAACVGENSNHAGERFAPGETGLDTMLDVCEGAVTPVPGPSDQKEPVKEKIVEEEVYVCSACGEGIAKAQEQLSQLFMGKALCKKCMDMKD